MLEPRAPRIHPFCYLVAQGLLAAMTIRFTKARSVARLPSLVIVLWLAYLEFTSAIYQASRGLGSSAVACFAYLYTAQLVNVLCLDSVSMEDVKTAGFRTKGFLSRSSFLSAIHLVAFNFRGIGTTWKSKVVPSFSTYFPGRIPQKRSQFLLRQIAVFTFQYLIIDMASVQTGKLSAKDREHLMGPGTEMTYFSATREQWIFRITSTMAIRWFVNRCYLSTLYNICSIFGVATGIFSPEDYPPFFGSVWSGYTLRGYWG
jgi:hypothetical protein